MKPLSQSLHDLVEKAVRDHYAHVRAVSGQELGTRYVPLDDYTLRILEVGVGTGSLPVALRTMGFDVYGLDDDAGGSRQVLTLRERFPTLKVDACALE